MHESIIFIASNGDQNVLTNKEQREKNNAKKASNAEKREGIEMETAKYCISAMIILMLSISCNNKSSITSIHDDSNDKQSSTDETRGLLGDPCFVDRTCLSSFVCNQAGICISNTNAVSHEGKIGFACRQNGVCDEGICNVNNVCVNTAIKSDGGELDDNIINDSDSNSDSDNSGNQNQPCKDDNTCNDNLQCNDEKICVTLDTALTEMIEVTWPNGGKYLIDKTTVTKEQYMTFLSSSPASQIDEFCSWNTDYLPSPDDNTWPPPKEKYSYPVGFVDWCDAKAYCDWAGKRLCSGTYSGYADANTDEWYNACSKGGSQKYPYGNDYQSGYCNDSNNGVGDTVPVLSMPNCKGGFDGLFDMAGNQWQWTGGMKDDERVVRGGTYNHGNDYSSCYDGTHKTSYPKTSKNNAVGFRCCKDAQ